MVIKRNSLEEVISDFSDKKQFYFAHPTYSRNSLREWELMIEKKYNLRFLNPFFDRDRPDSSDLNSDRLYSENLDLSSIVEGDLDAIDKCYGVVAMITEPSLGSAMELFYNSFVKNKPTYLIIEDTSLQNHPWLKYLASYPPFNSREDFVKQVLEKLRI